MIIGSISVAESNMRKKRHEKFSLTRSYPGCHNPGDARAVRVRYKHEATSCTSYLRLYAFISHVMPFTDTDLEKLYTFGRFLLLTLPKPAETDALRLDEEVQLKYYRIQKLSEGAISLIKGGEEVVYGPTDVGQGRREDVQAPLSEIIELLNERFGTDFKPEDQLTIDQFIADAKADTEIQKRAQANAFDNFALALRQPIEGLIIDRMERNEKLVTRYLNDPEFQEVLFRVMAQRIYDEVRGVGDGAGMVRAE
jgi:type I restriction enzyme, R subunit